MKQNQTKIKLLKIWEMLNTDSDELNPLSTNELLARLKEQGIDCDRRTLYNDIRTLNDYGFEVMCELKDHANQYYVAERGFDIPELKILMDAVTAANFISTKKTKQLHNKIASLAGSGRAELLKKSQDAINLTKKENEFVYYAVNEIDKAIMDCKQISFQYYDLNVKGEKALRKNGERYVVNPVATEFSSDRYYLIAFGDKRESLTHYRIDKMLNVTVEKMTAVSPAWLKKIDLAEHKKQLFSMFSGEEVRASFEADNSLIDVVFDKFGGDMKLRDLNNGKFAFSADVQISPIFFGWCLSFGDKLKLVSPDKLVISLKKYVGSIQL